MPRPLRVFLCHASQDKPAVLRLHRYLTQHGVEPWLDREELLPGQNWAVEISKALDATDVILVCLSKASISKEGFVQKEISFALDKALEKPEGMIFIIPVKLEECELPRSLNRFHWVDLFRDGGRRRLLMGLNKRSTELGEDVLPVPIEDAKQRTPKPFKPEIKQEEFKGETPAPLVIHKEAIKQENSAPELKKEIEPEKPVSQPMLVTEKKKEQTKKPFTKLLDSASLFPKRMSDSPNSGKDNALTDEATLKCRGQFPLTFKAVFTISLISIFLYIGIFYWSGTNNLAQLFPAATASSTSLNSLSTPEFVTSTSVPLTSTLQLTTTSIPAPTLGIGSTMISEKDGMALMYVPAGEFTMGTNYIGYSDATPEYKIFLRAFWIDQTEVTNAMYAKCVADDYCSSPSSERSFSRDSYYGNPEYENYPVIYVNWNQASEYCVWAGRDLPTEAEWEKAARGIDGRTFPWGEGISCEEANYDDQRCVGDTAKVGSYEIGASIYGALDMAGNVFEWVSSLHLPYPYDASDGREDLSASGTRVMRGGSWRYNWDYTDYSLRSYSRGGYDPLTTQYNIVGFRCARSS
ncbi:MAG: SUMF1/EgtB/PvdO family nonheme iron enzyme [Chloroflexi bacterium]|nr:SUMF1/EgtB/PvdO family nonheme iron enzyme [Chloroflexota bacterium]